MKAHSLFLSVIHIFLLLLVLGIGFFFLSFPWAPQFCQILARLILDHPKFFFSLGLVFLFVGLFLFLGLYFFHHSRYLQIEMKPFSCQIDPTILEKYIQNHWKVFYPNLSIRTEVQILKGEKLEILTYLPTSMPEVEKKIFFERAEEEIGKILQEHFRYKKNFIFTIFV